MSGDDLVFVTRKGDIWACWLSGRPAVNLGRETEVLAALAQLTGANGGPPRQRSVPAAPISRPIPSEAPAPRPTPRARPPVERAKPRHELTIVGRIFAVGGSREVTIRDLSETGCQFVDPVNLMREGTRLTIKVGTIGPIDATFRWRRGPNVGIEFTTPLYPSVLEHIRKEFAPRRK